MMVTHLTTLYCHYIRALNETEAFCWSGIRQHLRVHLCPIQAHKTRKPASRLDLASFYLSQLDGQNKLKCSGTRRYLTGPLSAAHYLDLTLVE